MSNLKLIEENLGAHFARPLSEIIEEMNELNCGSWSMSLKGKDGKALAAVIVVAGEHTQEVLDRVNEDE